MKEGQKINCTVENCKYNNIATRECALKAIVVEPGSKDFVESFEDQSMCGSFILDDKENK